MSIYYKEDDRISIHASSNEDDPPLNSCTYVSICLAVLTDLQIL